MTLIKRIITDLYIRVICVLLAFAALPLS